MKKLWGSRFSKATDALVHRFNASLSFDVRLYHEDISASIAWAQALARAGVLSSSEAEIIRDGLEGVRAEFDADAFDLQSADEDIHTAVERRLTEIVGPVGGKLHTGRSRNDQVATDFRLWTMSACDLILADVALLQRSLIKSAEGHLMLPMPGYTHLQHAQPVTWGHWVLSHFWPLARDCERFEQVRRRTAVMPLGAAALAGTAFPIDREALARALGFDSISLNSLDAVSDRDFAVDFLFAAAMLGVHLSRLSEQLIIYSSREFGFVTLDDAFSTGSSLMPQKKNPDTLELTRGKSGRLIGNLMGLLATLKGLPSSYDKDLQEDKEPVFDAFDTITTAVPVMSGLISTLRLNEEQMARQLEPGLLATDLADYLVKRGMPFREAHGVVGEAVRQAEAKGVPLTALTLEEMRAVNELFGEDVVDVLHIEASLSNRAVTGGTSAAALTEQLQLAKMSVRAQQGNSGERRGSIQAPNLKRH
jgi:argininosuccinate lyase